MLPLEPLASTSPVERLILRARAPEVTAELTRLEALDLTGLTAASRTFARAAFAMREGSLGPALTDFTAAAEAFSAAGDLEASELCQAEALLAKMRRGPRQAFAEAEAALETLAASACTVRVRVVATHYRGAALRLLGDAQKTQRALLDALALAEAHPPERPKILNSLGTLYVVLGAYGAAEALLEHAAELHHQRGDSVGEAIACGQLGAASLGLGDLAKARTWLQRQEWLASQVGDAFGRARALTFLADVALDLGHPDDALELANLAREVARSTTPPLGIWLAYATRAAGRARADLSDSQAEAELTDARARFTQIGNPLGLALTEWDLMHLRGASGIAASAAADANTVSGANAASAAGGAAGASAVSAAGGAAGENTVSAAGGAAGANTLSAGGGAAAGTGAASAPTVPSPPDGPPLTWSGPAWALASLGLSARVAALLRDHAELSRVDQNGTLALPTPESEQTFFAVAQPAPHLTVPREIALVYEAPSVLGDVSNRRTAAQRNLARLGALTLAPPGLFIATVTWTGAPRARTLPPERASCAAIAALPGTVQWAWPTSATEPEVKRDLEALYTQLHESGAENLKTEMTRHPAARVVSPPFAGEVSAIIEGLTPKP